MSSVIMTWNKVIQSCTSFYKLERGTWRIFFVIQLYEKRRGEWFKTQNKWKENLRNYWKFNSLVIVLAIVCISVYFNWWQKIINTTFTYFHYKVKKNRKIFHITFFIFIQMLVFRVDTRNNVGTEWSLLYF